MAYNYDRDNIARADGGPADDAYTISPHDTNPLPQACRALRIGGAGDIVVVTRSGNQRTWTALAGETIECGVTKVLSTGTTATNILGYV